LERLWLLGADDLRPGLRLVRFPRRALELRRDIVCDPRVDRRRLHYRIATVFNVNKLPRSLFSLFESGPLVCNLPDDSLDTRRPITRHIIAVPRAFSL
jgi:hypothetical protein